MGRRSENALKLVLLAAAIAVGAFLRFDALGEPSYWLDEILHQQLTTKFAATTPWWQWFGRLHEEHAGLYYLTQLATRLVGTTELAGRLAAVIFGLATIPVVYGVRQPQLPLSSAIAAILLATSPLHIYYSREARGYALLMFLTALLIYVLLRARSLPALCLVLVAMLYTSAVASTIIAAALAVSFAIALIDREHRRWYATACACAAVALVLCRAVYASRPVHDASWPGFPAMDWTFLKTLARMFSVSALGSEIGGRAAVSMFLFAVIGAIAITRHDRRHGIVLIGMTLLPFAITLAALRVFDHFFAVRYVVVALIGYVLLAGIGIATVARLLPRRVSPIIALAIPVIIAAQGWNAARTEPFRKLDWRGIAAALREHVQPGDVILTAEPWSEISLRYYLGEIPNVPLIHMAGVGIADIVLQQKPRAWLVTAGVSGDTSVRSWMCRYPVVMSSALENFRLHYAPSRRDFFQHRTRLPEQRAIAAALGVITAGNDFVFGDGWADAEGTFRWAVGKRATLVLPPRAGTIAFRAYPAAPQTMQVSLNGHALGAIALAHEWRDYSIDAPAMFWNEGLNTLTFGFEKTVVPSATDRRELAASFETITIDGAKGGPVQSMRISAFIDERTAWRRSTTRFPAATPSLLGRLGFDPLSVRRELHLENVAETIAYGSDCEDDLTFVNRAFAILLERTPNDIEKRDLLRRLRAGATREHIIRRIMNADDF